MKAIKLFLAAVAAAYFLAGCTYGYVFTYTREPLTLDMRKTPIEMKNGEGDLKHFKYQYVDIEWSSNAIGDIAKKHGLQELSFADIETFSILGIWTQKTVYVYGK